MRQEWTSVELIDLWTLVGEDWRWVGNKTGATRLGFAVSLKFFEIDARFPAYPEEVPSAAVEYVSSQVWVEATEFAKYSLSGRRRSITAARSVTRWGFVRLLRTISSGGRSGWLRSWPGWNWTATGWLRRWPRGAGR